MSNFFRKIEYSVKTNKDAASPPERKSPNIMIDISTERVRVDGPRSKKCSTFNEESLQDIPTVN